MTGKDVAIREDRDVALYELETNFAMAVRQRELLENYIRERLHPEKHFYTVGDEPGRKPSLTKEGAELICLPHNLKGHYDWLSGPEYPPMDDSPYQITMKCMLENNGKFEGEGVGSASSMVTRKEGNRVQRQKDPGLRHNATIKMACKSAYIAATLNSTAASEFFTQDLEDDQTGEFKKGHWCSIHKTPFFMKGKMKGYAHPIGDTGEWCHEHTDEKPLAKAKAEGKPVDKTQADKDSKELWPEDNKKTEPSVIPDPALMEKLGQATNLAKEQGYTLEEVRTIIRENFGVEKGLLLTLGQADQLYKMVEQGVATIAEIKEGNGEA